MTDFIKDLDQEIKALFGNKKVETMESNKNFIMFVVVLVLLGAVYFANKYKDRISLGASKITAGMVNTEKKSDFEANATSAMRKIWERTQWNTDNLTLTTTVSNHNLVVIQKNLPKSELIFINPDWTIDRIPDRIHLDPADQEYLKKFLKK